MTQKLSDKKLAVLGTGKLGGILLRAYLKQGLFAPKHVTATVKHAEKAATLAKELGVKVTTDNRKAVHGADIVLLGVKPQVVGEVLKEIAPELSEKTLVISVAASVPTSYIEQHAGAKVPVIRAMPNTPSTVGCGMTGICRGSHASAEHLDMARAMFDAVGRTVVVDEKNMDACDRPLGQRACVRLHHPGIARGGRRKSGLAARCIHIAGRANHEGRRQRRARNRRSSSAAEGRGDHASRLHHRRHPRTRRREAARDADQSGGESHAARRRTAVREMT